MTETSKVYVEVTSMSGKQRQRVLEVGDELRFNDAVVKVRGFLDDDLVTELGDEPPSGVPEDNN